MEHRTSASPLTRRLLSAGATLVLLLGVLWLVATEVADNKLTATSWLFLALTVCALILSSGHALLSYRDEIRRARRAVADQQALSELSGRALAATDERELTDDTLQAIKRSLSAAEQVLLLRIDERAETATVIASTERDHDRTPAPIAADVRRALDAAPWPLIVDDYMTERDYEPRERFRSALAVPCELNPPQTGVLLVLSETPAAFDSEDSAFLLAASRTFAAARQRIRMHSASLHAAHHDPLTGLPNRALFDRRLSEAVRRAQTGSALVVMMLDLDDFKNVNDCYGHAAGDQLLIELSQRLRAAVRPGDLVARLAGDEFLILMEDPTSTIDHRARAEQVLAAWAQPVQVAGHDMRLGASVGYTIWRDAAMQDAPELLREADAAMYRAKRTGKACVAMFDETMLAEAAHRAQMMAALHEAALDQELALHYQPVVSVASREVLGLEALLRWNSRDHGLLGPAEFLPLAEEAGALMQLACFSLQEACRQMQHWRMTSPAVFGNMYVSVNVAASQFADPTFVDEVARALASSGLPAHALYLELTETALLGDACDPADVAGRLRDLGVRLILDDFGSGYCSLHHPVRFPVSQLKVDRSFISGASSETDAIAAAIISMALTLEIDVVAEGVETEQQLARLRELGCGGAQGRLFAWRAAPERVPELVAQLAARPGA